MAVLEKIRVQMGIFITVLIAIALISFIIDPRHIAVGHVYVLFQNDVGEMNGQKHNIYGIHQKLENLKTCSRQYPVVLP